MRTGRNRRGRARLFCMLVVEYRGVAAWRSAAVLDLSSAGARLRIGEDLPSGTSVTLRFAAPLADGARSATFEADAVVKWCHREGQSYQAGMSFRDPAEGLEEILLALEQA